VTVTLLFTDYSPTPIASTGRERSARRVGVLTTAIDEKA
jgi:hypothetical protein